MRIIYTTGDDDLARVFVAETDDGSKIEFVESTQPPKTIDEKWVLIVSTLKGCPVGCPICDAGGSFAGKLSAKEILEQIDYLVDRRFKSRTVPVAVMKIQFARMGDPAFNDAVLEVLEMLPKRFDTQCLMPSISTVAPVGRLGFFDELSRIKNQHYSNGCFQMQFSIHTTDDTARKTFIPIRTLGLQEIACLGEKMFERKDRKIALNFAPAEEFPLDYQVIRRLFNPDKFLIKLTPINPTVSAKASGFHGLIDPENPAQCKDIAAGFEQSGFETILSIGELRENQIGSNCGMYVSKANQSPNPKSQSQASFAT